jgi:hypothetical protein
VKDEEKFIREITSAANEIENIPENMEPYIKMQTEKETYSLPITGMNLIIKNTGYENLYAVQKCNIEKYENDQWKPIDYGEVYFKDYNGASHTIGRKGEINFYIPLQELKGIFNPGKYRILKEVESLENKYNVTCEFNLE